MRRILLSIVALLLLPALSWAQQIEPIQPPTVVSIGLLKPLAATAVTVSLDPAKWTINWPNDPSLGSFGMPPHPFALTGMIGWFLDFPDAVPCTQYGDICSPRYVWQNVAGSIATKSLITFTGQTVVVDGAPVLTANLASDNQPPSCPETVYARVMLWKKGLSWTDYSARWWSHQALDLKAFDSETVISSLTDLSNWSNVNGQFATSNPKAFQTVLANLWQVSLTFGGGCYFGHGVAVVPGTGHARFILTNYQVQ